MCGKPLALAVRPTNKMRSDTIHTPAQIVDIYREMKPKFIALKNPAGAFDIRYNQPKAGHVDKKFKEITERLKHKTLPAGIYVVSMKNDNYSTSNETEFPVQVGKNVQTLQTSPMQTTEAKSVLSLKETLELMAQVQTLSIQLTNANEKIKDQTTLIAELERELDKAENNPLSASGENSWMKDLKETAEPLVKLYFEQRERSLAIEEKKLGLSSSSQQRTNISTEREDKGIHPTDKRYREYFEAILHSKNEEALDYELDYLEKNFSKLYDAVCKHYDLLEDETENENEPGQTNEQ